MKSLDIKNGSNNKHGKSASAMYRTTLVCFPSLSDEISDDRYPSGVEDLETGMSFISSLLL